MRVGITTAASTSNKISIPNQPKGAFMSSLLKTASWVIVDLSTGEGVFETFSEKTAKAINQKKYKAVPILEWLQGLNAKR
jgi:hypothetical protein